MELFKTILSKTCVFILKTSFENSFLAQEWGSGTSGHLMRLARPKDNFNDYYKFYIYPDPNTEGSYRMIVAGHPDLQVQLESNRARIVKFKDTDYQKFKFTLASPPKSEIDKSKEWSYVKGVGVDKNFDFASHKYVYPSDSNADRTKLRLVPVSVVQPDASMMQETISYSVEELAPPQNYEKTNRREHGLKLISIESIPAALIADNDYRNKIDQMKMSPYYYLKHEKLWSTENLPIVALSKNVKKTIDEEYTSSFASTDYKSIEKTVGHTFSASIKLYAKVKGGAGGGKKAEAGAAMQLAYQYQNQTKTINQQSHSEEVSVTKRIKSEFRQLDSGEGDIFVYHWVEVDRYTLLNSKGEVKATWDHRSNEPIPQEVKR